MKNEFFEKQRQEYIESLCSGAWTNYNELFLPISFEWYAQQHNIRGKYVSWSYDKNCWELWNDQERVEIVPPFEKGSIGQNFVGKAKKFNGHLVENVCIKYNYWCLAMSTERVAEVTENLDFTKKVPQYKIDAVRMSADDFREKYGLAIDK